MKPMKLPGKKIGMLEVKLDRKKTRYTWAKIAVELRFEIADGTFHTHYEGNRYSAKTKDDLTAQIKAAATKSLSIDWKRYIQINYEAEGWPIEDAKSGRPAVDGRYHTYDIHDDRLKFDDKDEKNVICAIKLQWSICEISEPYPLPEDPNKCVRAQRQIDVCGWGSQTGEEQIGEPQEWQDAVLPPGTVLWTPAREALLVEVVAALGKLDARLVDLFSGDHEKLAGKIDAAAQTDASRLLSAPADPSPGKPTKQRRA